MKQAGLRGAVIKVQAARLLPRRDGGAAIFLPGIYARFSALLALVASLGCSTAAGREAMSVARSQNDYDFLEARYEDACRVPVPPAPCVEARAALEVWRVDLHRRSFVDWTAAKPSVPRTGPTPLHDAALEADEKAAKAATRKVLP
jgi:hypothetical protein